MESMQKAIKMNIFYTLKTYTLLGHFSKLVVKEVKRLCKEFGFTAGMLKGSLADGRKKQS